MLLQERIALVTGAGSGVGRAVAEAYAADGATVILVGRRQETLIATYDHITGAGGKASIAPLDLEHQLGRVAELAQGILQRFGRLDILVNNAAILGNMTPLAAYDPVVWESVLRVNLTAPFFLIRELMPLLRQSLAASVINVVCDSANHGLAYWGAYAASKAALLNLSQTWAQELAPTTVRLNTVNPGVVASTIRTKAFPGEDPKALPQPREAVPAFRFLASDYSRKVNGACLQAAAWQDWQDGPEDDWEPRMPHP